MTPHERRNPGLINGSRRKRIANGSGTKVQNVNQLVKQFDQMKVLMKSMANGQAPTPQQMAKLASGGQRAPRPKARRR
jgi:signal recognition particle subunit SRP54